MDSVIDRFGNILNSGDTVDVQSVGRNKIYIGNNGLLCFKPYGVEELVSSYFSNDLEKIEITVNVQQVFKNWCTKTKRSGGVLVGSSIQEFLRELQAKIDEK